MTFEHIFVGITPFVGIGFLLGCFPLLLGLGVQGGIHILKRI